MRLAPRWEDPVLRDETASIWQRTRSLRIDGLLVDEDARALRDALRGLPHELRGGGNSPSFAFQYGSLGNIPEPDCDHMLCQFGRWWWSIGLAFVNDITGMSLHPPEDRMVVSTLFQRGSFIDPHNDYDRVRRCAFILGLTEATWPASEGGHLEFLEMDGSEVRVCERRAPGWNTLDLFDVTGTDRVHQVPILTRDVERRAFSGWFY
jgi:hypothetical protein